MDISGFDTSFLLNNHSVVLPSRLARLPIESSLLLLVRSSRSKGLWVAIAGLQYSVKLNKQSLFSTMNMMSHALLALVAIFLVAGVPGCYVHASRRAANPVSAAQTLAHKISDCICFLFICGIIPIAFTLTNRLQTCAWRFGHLSFWCCWKN